MDYRRIGFVMEVLLVLCDAVCQPNHPYLLIAVCDRKRERISQFENGVFAQGCAMLHGRIPIAGANA
jgi:hypothetical protein